MRLSFLILSFLLFACGERSTSPGRAEQAQGSGESHSGEGLNLQMSKFEEIDSSGILMFPLAMSETGRRGEPSKYKSVPYNVYWNILFYNSRTGERHLLDDSMVMLINDFGYNYPEQRSKLKSADRLFFNLTIKDMNGDGELDGEDPNYLFVTDNSGRNLQQVSPDSCDFFHWYVLKHDGLLVMLVRKDSNGDKKFDEEDEKAAYAFDLSRDSIARELFPVSYRDTLRSMYHRQWQREVK